MINTAADIVPKGGAKAHRPVALAHGKKRGLQRGNGKRVRSLRRRVRTRK